MWLKFEEIEQLEIDRRWIQIKVKSGEWESRSTGLRGRNGKEIREVKLESLPPQLQAKWVSLQPETENQEIEEIQTDSSLTIESKLVLALKRYEPKVRDAFRNEAIRLSKIVVRYELINPKRIKNADGKYDFVAEVAALCEETICDDPIVLSVEPSRSEPCSPFTLDSWWRKSKTDGLAVFLRKPSTPQKSSDNRKAKISPEAIEWVNSNWRKFASARHLYKDLKKLANKKAWKIPAETWFYRMWKSIPNIVSTSIQKGSKSYTSKYAPYVPRTVEDLQALQILCGDHSVRDVTVVLPDGSLTRPWLTLWYDLRTGLIWGWHLDLTPSSVTAGLAYANGVRTFGAQPTARPDSDFYSYLYTDQGKDYKSKTWDGKTLTFKKAMRIEGGLEIICHHRKVGFFEETGIKHLLSRGYNAKEKPVERVHRDISDWEQNTFYHEYVGRDAKNKPERWVDAWQRHERLRKKFKGDIPTLLQETDFMTLDDYKESLVNGFINEYNTIAHTRTVLGDRKVVPIEEFERLYSTRYEINQESLALLLMKTPDVPKLVGKNGVSMTFGGRKYEYLHPDMARFKGEKIEIRYSDDDYSHVWAILPAAHGQPSQIVKAELITRTPILNLNKQTAATIAKQVNHERKVIRDFQFLNQSNMRGETTEDRVAQLLDQPEAEEIEMPKAAAGGGSSIRIMNRFDAPKIDSVKPKILTTEEVSNIETNDNIFRFPDKKKVLSEWEED